jgi:hypothetical protein
MGVHGREEMIDSHVGFENAKDVTPGPKLAERLSAVHDVIMTADIDEALAAASGETVS